MEGEGEGYEGLGCRVRGLEGLGVKVRVRVRGLGLEG